MDEYEAMRFFHRFLVHMFELFQIYCCPERHIALLVLCFIPCLVDCKLGGVQMNQVWNTDTHNCANKAMVMDMPVLDHDMIQHIVHRQ